jgi:hypothetical protein
MQTGGLGSVIGGPESPRPGLRGWSDDGAVSGGKQPFPVRLAAGSLGVELVGKHTTSNVHDRFVEWLGINLRCHHATVLAHA